MGGNPSGRGQTLVLAAWLQEQISACTSHQTSSLGMQSLRTMQNDRDAVTAEHVSESTPISKDPTEAANAAADESSKSQDMNGEVNGAAASATLDENADPSASITHQAQGNAKHAAIAQEHNLVLPRSPRAAWNSPRSKGSKVVLGGLPGPVRRLGLSSASHLPSSASQLTLAHRQGLLLEDFQDLGLSCWAEEIIRDHPDKSKRVIGLLGNAFGVLVHQVAMHCFERGALMASVWNMYTALMDAEVQLLEENVQVVIAADFTTSKGQHRCECCQTALSLETLGMLYQRLKSCLAPGLCSWW